MRWGARTGLLAVLAVGAAAGIVAVPVAQAEASGCREVRIPVEIDGATGDIAGTLCVPPSATRVQVLIPGWLNNRGYWNLAYGSGEYSYVREMNRRGEATLAVDRLGTGSSWHPPSSMVTYAAHVRAIGQVVDALREGTLMPGARSVVLVGHSYGSRVAYGVASVSEGVDAVVATSLRQNWISYVTLTASPVTTAPAAQDPRFADMGLDPGYVTTRPGRADSGFNEANTDPGVISAAAELRDVGSVLEAPTARDALATQSAGVNVPVLIVLGSADLLTCGPGEIECRSADGVAEAERGLFGPRASVRAVLVPGSGHALNLERTHTLAWTAISDFLTELPR